MTTEDQLKDKILAQLKSVDAPTEAYIDFESLFGNNCDYEIEGEDEWELIRGESFVERALSFFTDTSQRYDEDGDPYDLDFNSYPSHCPLKAITEINNASHIFGYFTNDNVGGAEGVSSSINRACSICEKYGTVFKYLYRDRRGVLVDNSWNIWTKTCEGLAIGLRPTEYRIAADFGFHKASSSEVSLADGECYIVRPSERFAHSLKTREDFLWQSVLSMSMFTPKPFHFTSKETVLAKITEGGGLSMVASCTAPLEIRLGVHGPVVLFSYEYSITGIFIEITPNKEVSLYFKESECKKKTENSKNPYDLEELISKHNNFFFYIAANAAKKIFNDSLFPFVEAYKDRK